MQHWHRQQNMSPPPLSAEALTEATQALGGIFVQIIDEATIVSALKTQQHAAKQKVEKRDNDYDKGKGHHEKFPSIKDMQTARKIDSDKDFKIISEKVIKKSTLLRGLAIQAAEKLIPTLLVAAVETPVGRRSFGNV